MKRKHVLIALSLLLAPAFAQTNQPGRAGHPEWRRGDHAGRRGENGDRKFMDRFRGMSPEEKAERQERRLQLMEKTLKEIGVTEEQQQQIKQMQLQHRKDMEKASRALDEARKKLTALEKADAPQEDIYSAIDAVAAAQAEQMKVLSRNKMEMQRILGKEKFKQFMEAARNSYRSHGRRGGYGIPPVPNRTPPVPDQSGNKKTAPAPQAAAQPVPPPPA